MNQLQLGPLAQEAPPEVVNAMEERNELFRLAAVAALARGGHHLSPEDRARHEHWARQKPLGRSLSQGATPEMLADHRFGQWVASSRPTTEARTPAQEAQ